MKILVVAALASAVPGCVASAPVTTDAAPGDATSSDAPGSDASTTVDAGPGDPGLARAPKNCTTLVNDAAVNAQFGPGWKAHRYVPNGTADIQEHYLCPSVPGPVLGVVSKYSGAQVPAGQAPSVGIARVDPIAPPFSISYVIESIDQASDPANGFAGVLVLSLQLPNYGALAINRRSSDGQYFMMSQTQAGDGASTPLGALTPPFRVRLDTSWTNGVMSIDTTITTATAETRTTSVVAAPNQMMTLTLGANRSITSGATRIVYSDLVLP